MSEIATDMKVLRMVGVPYTDDMIENAVNDAYAQTNPESDNLDGLLERYSKVNYRNFDNQAVTTELDALIAYLQVLGTMAELQDYKPATPTSTAEVSHD
jgi:cytochrome c oxidase cbb3-type subunit 2